MTQSSPQPATPDQASCADERSPSTEQIWEMLSDKLRGFFRSRVSDPQVAEDLLQDAFIRIHKGLADIRHEERIVGWAFQIGRNLVNDHYRSKDRALVTTDTSVVPDWQNDPDNANLNAVVANWLPELVRQLPDSYREAVELYEFEGVPQQEIADRLGISLSGAKSRIQRGREKLRTLLFECCAFQKDRRGNVIECTQNDPQNLGTPAEDDCC